ncbi:MAG TPA: GNAT family N-acetyltransferase [Iamia sp.]
MTTIPTTTPTPTVARATAWDRGRLVNVLSAAFADDPVFTWIEPDPTRRAAILPATFGAFAAAFARHETTDLVRIDGAAAGAALWAPPGVEPVHPDDADLIGEAMGVYTPEAQARIGALMAAFEAAHPKEPAWYLNFLGVTPARQGLGLGSALLRPVLHRGDVAGHGAYLEATSERNRALYERHGFRCVGDIPLPDGPTVYAMGRKPVRP